MSGEGSGRCPQHSADRQRTREAWGPKGPQEMWRCLALRRDPVGCCWALEWLYVPFLTVESLDSQGEARPDPGSRRNPNWSQSVIEEAQGYVIEEAQGSVLLQETPPFNLADVL